MRTVELPGGETVPVLGLGTWHMGETAARFDMEVGAVRYAMDRGMTLIDTAESYANGGAEEVVGAAIDGFGAARRDDIFIVSKVLPSNAHSDGVIQACERSLRRLGTTHIDLYLLHWRGSTTFQETLDALQVLRSSGKIRYFGVSNFDADDMAEWCRCDGGSAVAANQILYNLSRRGVEWDVIPQCRDRGVPVMAYSPLEQGRLDGDRALSKVAMRHEATPLQIALAWVLAQQNVMAIPKAASYEHIDQNMAALEISLDAEDHAILDAAYPPPGGPSALEML